MNFLPKKKGVIQSVDAESYTATVLMNDEDVVLQGVKVCSAMTNPNNQINLIQYMVNMQVWIEFDQHSQPYITLGLFNDQDSPNQDYNVLFENIVALINNFSLKGSMELNSGNYGGLVIAKNLVDKINRLENDINTLKQALTSWVPVPQDGGAALKTATASWAANTITPITQAADLENTTITHGDSTT